MDSFFRKFNQAGMSIIEILVSLGILSIIMSVMATFMTNQQRETRALKEKLSVLDLEKQTITLLLDGSICTAELTDPTFNPGAPFTINGASAVALQNTQILLPRVRSSATVTAPNYLQTTQPISPTTPTVVVREMGYRNFASTGSANNYFADFFVEFERDDLVYPIKAVTVRSLIRTRAGDPIGNQRIELCVGGVSSNPLRVESANGVFMGNPADCTASYSGGLCSSSWRRDITFATPFTSPPNVIVVPEIVSQQGGCVGGATDKIVSVPTNITATGFTLIAAGSPAGPGCGAFEGWASAAQVGWMAIGE